MSSLPPVVVQSVDWARQYRHFAAHECSQDPLYVAICQAVAAVPELLALMQEVPATQARPNLLLAALHERVLAGATHALADYYPSVGGTRTPDAALPALLLDLARQQRPALLAHLRGRATQTNEIGRCAVLWPALQRLAALSGKGELALFDFGSSAGLNLGVDRYHYDYGLFQRGARPDPERPRIACRWLGEAAPPPPQAGFELVARLGVDLAPVDLLDEQEVRWLRACLWPCDRPRAQRLDQALALARAAGPAVERHAEGLDRLERWLDELPAGVQPVLFNSWVLAYLEPAALARYQARVAGLVRARGLAWISAEAAALRPAGLALPAAAVAGVPPQTATLWSLQWREGRALRQRALAWSHAHGQWVHWLDR